MLSLKTKKIINTLVLGTVFTILIVLILGCTSTVKLDPVTQVDVAVKANCTTTYINFHKPLTDRDKGAIIQAKKRCAELYPEAPCLKNLQRMEDGVYRAICGE